MTFEFWFLLPIAFAIATLAMASGIGGATFFSPLFILALRLEPEVAIGTALITETFGFASGLTAYIRDKVIDFKLGGIMLMATIPMAIVGTYLSGVIDANILKLVLAVGLLAVAISFLHAPDDAEMKLVNAEAMRTLADTNPDACITARDGEQICYVVKHKFEGLVSGGIGGLFVGLISTGLGELNDYFLLKRCKVPSRVAVATSVFVIAVTVLVASGGHVVRFASAGSETINEVLSLVIFTVPGVLVGGQVGPKVAAKVPERTMQVTLSVLFILIAFLTFGEVILE
ncbi:MAG: sulfite exporter TauE/SafE family protein [Spirochaetia bacterium]